MVKKRCYKKAQETGSSAALLVGIIALIVVLYIVILPPSEREKLLGEDTDGGKADKDKNISILLEEFVGRIDFVKEPEDIDLPNVFLVKSTESKVLERVGSILVRNGWFDKKSRNVTFSIKDLENIDNVKLVFTAKERKGSLSINLNDNNIFEGEISQYNPDPISLSKDLLSSTNVLKFGVNGVGWKFWRTNEYVLQDVRIIGDVTDVSRQKSQNVFSLTSAQFLNLERAQLKFVPYCASTRDIGILTISINNRAIFSAVPICNDPYTIDMPLSVLNGGDNFIIFNTEEGSYSIEQIKVKTELKDILTVTYYFEVNNTQFKHLQNGSKELLLEIKFVDTNERKRADLTINGHKTRLDLDDDETVYEKEITSWAEKGNNYILIDPKTTLEIVSLKIWTQKT